MNGWGGEYASVFAYIIGLGLLFVFGWVFIGPIKKLLKLIINSIIGGAIIYIINVFGYGIGLGIGLNPFTALTAGLLGIPGIGMMLLLKRILI